MSLDPHEPTSELCHIPIRDNGEPMIDVLTLSNRIFLDRPRFDYKRETVLRIGVAERFAQAAERLPAGYRFALVEGWRPPFIQSRMFRAVWKDFAEKFPELSEEELRPIVERYSAPMEETVPPPHTTGAAFDLALYFEEEAVDLCSPFGWRDHDSFAFDAPGISETARRHRDIMGEAFAPTGITNYPSEYWHWSYGDQGWAYRGGHPHALYAAIEPPGWKPEPRDAIDAPLEFLAEYESEDTRSV